MKSGWFVVVPLTMVSACVQAQTARHVDMHMVRQAIDRSESGSVAIVLFGDSRSSWTKNRVPGAIFRNWDVKWGALVCDSVTANQGAEDGLGQALYTLASTDLATVQPGTFLPGSGLLNRYPVTVAEQWVRPDSTESLWVTLNASVASTAGYAMALDDTGRPGGTFKRGDPAQGRPIESIEYFALSNNTHQWLGAILGLDFGDVAWPWQVQQEFPAPSGPSGMPSITTRTMPCNGATGGNIRVVMGYLSSEAGTYAGKGHNWLGPRINFQGQVGCVLGTIAQGGWSISDHLPASVRDVNDNFDWKYGTAELTEWYQHCMHADRAVIRWEVGANISPLFRYEEDADSIKESTRLAIERVKGAFAAAGAHDVVVELVSYWGSEGDEGGPESRSTIWRQALHDLAVEQGWSFYDQLGALIDGGYTLGNSLRYPYRIDAGHQNFAGMSLLGQLEWSVISSAVPECATADFNGDGDVGTDADIEAFFACLAGNCCPACWRLGADVNNDGDTGTDADIEAFFRVLAGNPC